VTATDVPASSCPYGWFVAESAPTSEPAPDRATGDAAPAEPAPQPLAARRRFDADYKRALLAEYDAAAPGEKQVILRREALHSSYVSRWRQTRLLTAPDTGGGEDRQPGDYLASGPAARRLLVSPRTINRWADAGLLSSIVTPGGQRR
jgi:hypothetical protein